MEIKQSSGSAERDVEWLGLNDVQDHKGELIRSLIGPNFARLVDSNPTYNNHQKDVVTTKVLAFSLLSLGCYLVGNMDNMFPNADWDTLSKVFLTLDGLSILDWCITARKMANMRD